MLDRSKLIDATIETVRNMAATVILALLSVFLLSLTFLPAYGERYLYGWRHYRALRCSARFSGFIALKL